MRWITSVLSTTSPILLLLLSSYGLRSARSSSTNEFVFVEEYTTDHSDGELLFCHRRAMKFFEHVYVSVSTLGPRGHNLWIATLVGTVSGWLRPKNGNWSWILGPGSCGFTSIVPTHQLWRDLVEPKLESVLWSFGESALWSIKESSHQNPPTPGVAILV